jgi:hypothetical protein
VLHSKLCPAILNSINEFHSLLYLGERQSPDNFSDDSEGTNKDLCRLKPVIDSTVKDKS